MRRTTHGGVRRRPPAGRPAQLAPAARCGTPTTSRCGRLCEELDVPLNIHAGSGHPRLRRPRDGAGDHAGGAALVRATGRCGTSSSAASSSGIPALRLALTEQGVAWLPRGLETLDWFYAPDDDGGERRGAVLRRRRPRGLHDAAERSTSRRNFWVGASFLRPSEAAAACPTSASSRIMWGDDYPHSEGTYPYTREALRVAFSRLPARPRSRAMVETNAAAVLRVRPRAPSGRSATASGPTVDEVAEPLAEADYPPESTCNAFERERAIKAW